MATDRNRLILQALKAEKALRSRLRRRGIRPHEIDDISQEVYRRMLESASVPGEIRSMKAYVFRLGRNIVVDGIRHNKCVAGHESSAIASPHNASTTGGPDEDLDAERIRYQLLRAFRSLPYPTRRVLWRRKVRGQSQQEIAERLGITVHAVEAYLTKGKDLLDRALAPMMDDEERQRVIRRIWKQRRSHEDEE